MSIHAAPDLTTTTTVSGRVTTGFAVLDLETTGLSPGNGARAIEIGVVLVDADGYVEDRWETLVDAGCGPGPTHIHGITAAMLVGASDFGTVAGDLATRLDGRVLVAHNAAFDVGFLDAEFDRAGITWRREPLCTMRLARRRGHRPATLAYLCDVHDIVNEHAHKALGDALATAELLGRLAARPAEIPAPVAFPDGHPDPSGVAHRRPEDPDDLW